MDCRVCPICRKSFSRVDNMKRHMDTIHTSIHEVKDQDKFSCPICHKTFTRVSYVKKHQETVHKTTHNDTTVSHLISQITELKSELKERDEQLKCKIEENNERMCNEIQELKNKPINQVLQIVCVTNHDNYLDMLTDRMGNFDQAIEYIKDCALSDLSGDCKLIEKIYKNQNDELSFIIDRKSSKIFYQNEKNQSITESKDLFGRKLANNLQNSYLKGINYLINKNLDKRGDPNKFIDDYDIVTWNTHIYQLSDALHQHRIINQLNLPQK